MAVVETFKAVMSVYRIPNGQNYKYALDHEGPGFFAEYGSKPDDPMYVGTFEGVLTDIDYGFGDSRFTWAMNGINYVAIA